MVFHVLRLERNWGRRRPDYLSMKTIRLGPGHRILHAVPGTPLLFVHSGLSGDVCVPSYLVVITIQTASPSPIIEVPFRRPLEASFTFGLLRVFDMGRLEIVAFNRFNGACRIIRTDTFYDRRMGAFLDGSLYVVNHRSDFSSNVYNCPSHFLPYNDSEGEEPCITDTLKWDDGGIRFWSAVDANYVGLETWLEALGALSHTPFRGAALTTLHYINVDEEPLPSAINIRFWSFKDRMIATTSRLSRPPYLVANSDVSVLILVSYDDGLGLLLVRYDPSAFSSAICHPRPSISSVALDDHRGVVMFIEDDVLYSVSYA
ncbi:hypothetical protein B0H14DRAFT_2717640 [Mycena olivaceomarginata]|nr:hypothetical protein B0H14DRAFT_2717640 [Mycena olivaceomarginata]